MNQFAQPVLTAHDITLGYRHGRNAAHDVLRDFSFTLHAREIVAVLGPSGVGKSTLVRVLAALQQADAGRVTVFDKPADAPNPAVGVVFQDACLLPWRSVRGNVMLGLDFASRRTRERAVRRRARADAALAEVGLSTAADLYPAQLSGGMAQRVSLARCMARQPDILLLDEPFAALDAATRTSMQALLRNLVNTHGAAAVMVTHDIDEALRVADRVLLLCGSPARAVGDWRLARHSDTAALRATIVAALADASVTAAGSLPQPAPILPEREVA